jgi:hypothetical protein
MLVDVSPSFWPCLAALCAGVVPLVALPEAPTDGAAAYARKWRPASLRALHGAGALLLAVVSLSGMIGALLALRGSEGGWPLAADAAAAVGGALAAGYVAGCARGESAASDALWAWAVLLGVTSVGAVAAAGPEHAAVRGGGVQGAAVGRRANALREAGPKIRPAISRAALHVVRLGWLVRCRML